MAICNSSPIIVGRREDFFSEIVIHVYFYYVAILVPPEYQNLWPRGHEFQNFVKGLHEHHKDAISFFQLLCKKRFA